jgi:hypothetical protein
LENALITAQKVPPGARAAFVGNLFGVRFLWIESFAFDTAGSLSPDYDGGVWNYFDLSNGGFYMAPHARESFTVDCANGFSGPLSADAFGITACLYAYSLLSYSADKAFAETCVAQYHLLREFALQHAEARGIFAATD